MSDNDCDACKKHCPNTLKCSAPNSNTVVAVPLNTPTPFTVASRTLNKSELCNSNILLEFSTNIVINEIFTGNITFQVYRLCNNQITPIPVGPAWIFSRTITETLPTVTETFSFFVCDSNDCGGECCTYSVVATINASVFPTDTIYINNATISIFT